VFTLIIFKKQMIYGFQIKAGRGILRMSQIELSKLSSVSIPTIQRIENDEEFASNATQNTIKKLTQALEKAGIKFIRAIDEVGNGAGVKLWKDVAKTNENT
jgi:transcriptional regulator with XRE-family HTH domain